MRMPFLEFLMGGDPKFMIVLLAVLVTATIHFIKKLKSKNEENGATISLERNTKLSKLVFWSLMVSVFSFLLGFMHSFYFIGKAGGIAPHLMYQGASHALITPVFGVAVAMITKFFTHIANPKVSNI